VLAVVGLESRVGAFRLGRLDLSVPAGAYCVVLGPPGSGKSVLLETLCGLRRVHAGSVRLGDLDITYLDPRARRIGYVPQDYALFPSKRVLANLTFGLRARGTSRREARAKVQPLIEMLGVRELVGRWPATLSGGEQQRVALGRALATEPRLLLLDEPVSALDESTRDRVCRELRRIQREFAITTLHVSHNLEEAFSVSDVAAVMRDGRVVQQGPLSALVRQPRTAFVARFLRAENVLSGRADGAVVRLGDLALPLPRAATGPISVMIRPENVGVATDNDALDPAATHIPARIERRVDRGPYVRLDLDGPLPLVAYASHHLAAHLPTEPGARVVALIHPESVHVLEADA
jgi:molybdate/tungstate transport system ATP-binding protein